MLQKTAFTVVHTYNLLNNHNSTWSSSSKENSLRVNADKSRNIWNYSWRREIDISPKVFSIPSMTSFHKKFKLVLLVNITIEFGKVIGWASNALSGVDDGADRSLNELEQIIQFLTYKLLLHYFNQSTQVSIYFCMLSLIGRLVERSLLSSLLWCATTLSQKWSRLYWAI